MKLVLTLLTIISFFHAAASPLEGKTELSLSGGAILPSGNPYLTEVMQAIAITYKPLWSEPIEMSFFNGNQADLSWNQLSARYREDFRFQDFVTFASVGLDLNINVLSNGRRPTDFDFGPTVGSGVLIPVSSSVWFRSDVRFSFATGTALLLNVGFTATFE